MRAEIHEDPDIAVAMDCLLENGLPRSKKKIEERFADLDAKYTLIGFDSENNVPAGAQYIVTAHPVVRFTGMRLIIPPTPSTRAVPFHPFQIVDIMVGKNSQRIDSVPIPGWIFSATMAEGKPGAYRGERISMEMAEVSAQIALMIRNIDVAGHRFQAAIWGKIER